ncbi:MAG: MBL fold metallo-hydrolase [Gammaproteobacteria bacterium]|jgi:hydroxyacylglutathione hydrolase
MFIETIKTEGLSHLSYVLGSEGVAAVVDPRRDCGVYTDIAAARGCRLTHVFETHRNEDILSGARILAERTGATVHHGPNAAADVTYAETVREGDKFEVGRIRVHVIETPGHTDDSVSYVVYDADYPRAPIGVFTGDTLFVGDVGRCDFYPERAEEVAGLMYDSLGKIVALGEQAIVYPAHGAGSVCGSGMADRDFSTIGHEIANNPRIAIADREAFVRAKLAEHHEYPPYFERMERLNLTGAEPAKDTAPPPLSSQDVSLRADEVTLVDIRSAAAFLGAHLPNSLALPLNLIDTFAGWMLDPDQPLVLVAEGPQDARAAATRLVRIGYDNVVGFLGPDLVRWAASGRAFGTLDVISADAVAQRLEDPPADWTLLDVRGLEEVESTRIPGSRHIYLGELPRRVDELDPDRCYTLMCGSGSRATVAGSVLLRAGFARLDLFLGSLGAWKQRGFKTEDAA